MMGIAGAGIQGFHVGDSCHYCNAAIDRVQIADLENSHLPRCADFFSPKWFFGQTAPLSGGQFHAVGRVDGVRGGVIDGNTIFCEMSRKVLSHLLKVSLTL